MDRNYNVITFTSKYLHFKKSWSSRLLKQPLKTKKKFKDLEIIFEMQSISAFLDTIKIADFW